jgi:hypothetical protein
LVLVVQELLLLVAVVKHLLGVIPHFPLLHPMVVAAEVLLATLLEQPDLMVALVEAVAQARQGLVVLAVRAIRHQLHHHKVVTVEPQGLLQMVVEVAEAQVKWAAAEGLK